MFNKRSLDTARAGSNLHKKGKAGSRQAFQYPHELLSLHALRRCAVNVDDDVLPIEIFAQNELFAPSASHACTAIAQRRLEDAMRKKELAPSLMWPLCSAGHPLASFVMTCSPCLFIWIPIPTPTVHKCFRYDPWHRKLSKTYHTTLDDAREEGHLERKDRRVRILQPAKRDGSKVSYRKHLHPPAERLLERTYAQQSCHVSSPHSKARA